MLDHLPQDPEVARLRAELQSSLARMGEGLESLGKELVRGRDGASTPLTFRVDGELEAGLARYMRHAGITNQARALRTLLSLGLAAAQARG